MPGPYATPEQYQQRTGRTPPPDIDVRLSYASEDVTDALLTAVYDTDPATGAPTDSAVIQALADATCDQVAYVIESGGDTTGAAGQWDNVSIGPVSLGGRRTGGTPGVTLGPRASGALRRAGLLPGVIL